MEIVDRELATPRFKLETSPTYLELVRKFIFDNLANKMAEMRRRRGMFDALEKQDEWDEYTDLSMGASGKTGRVRLFLDLTHLYFVGRRGQNGFGKQFQGD